MNKQTRIERIKAILGNKKPMGNMEVFWEDELQPMDIYKIPLNYLIYNKYNGRILSRTKSLESQRKTIDVETNEGKAQIEKLLWDSTDRNKKTLESIKNLGGQQKPGFITRDGVIIDGNRRAMLLNRTDGMYEYFKAVILPVTSEENPLEIEKLETTFQMGEDEKVGYNATEKYLKAKGLYQTLSQKSYNSKETENNKIVNEAINKIADWMGEKDSVVTEYLQTMETMDDYLAYLDYDGIYTQLDKNEDQFIKLTKWINSFYEKESAKAFDGYRDVDVDELKTIAYDYLRIKYDGKKFRYLAEGNRDNHFFGNKDIWTSFKNIHLKRMEGVVEERIDLNSQNLERHLNERDKRFDMLSSNEGEESFMDENVDSHLQQLNNIKAAGQPGKLLKRARQTLESINQNHKSFTSPEVAQEIEGLNGLVEKMLSASSPEKVLSHITNLLDKIDITSSTKNKDILMDKAKKIQSAIYQITKEIKKL